MKYDLQISFGLYWISKFTIKKIIKMKIPIDAEARTHAFFVKSYKLVFKVVIVFFNISNEFNINIKRPAVFADWKLSVLH